MSDPPPLADETLDESVEERLDASPTMGQPSAGRVLAQASLILTVAALASRALGWLRLLVIGSQFGAGRELDAYFAAFRIPDAIFQLVVAGALSAALIPVFQGYRAKGDEAEAWRLWLLRAVAGDPHAGSVDSAERNRGSNRILRTDDCDWFPFYRVWHGSASVLRMGIVCGAAVLPGTVLGAGIQLPRAALF